jgi:hypothetical protein
VQTFHQYNVLAKTAMGMVGTTMFWKDIWNFGSLQELYPNLFSFSKEPNYLVSKSVSKSSPRL